jgi:hypothetical protein
VAVLAGPPLLCWPFDIGGAKSLPFAGDNWRSSDPSYNIKNLADDTLAILQPNTPVIVRMETIRRATVYAMKDRAIAGRLLQRLEARVRDAEKSGKPDALALFDLGYMLETFKQTGHREDSLSDLTGGRDGYGLIANALQLRGSEPEMEFGAALATLVKGGAHDSTVVREGHCRRALAGAKEGSLLAKNLVTHAQLLQLSGTTVAELRAQVK